MSLSKVQSKLYTTNDQMRVEPRTSKSKPGKAINSFSSFSKTPIRKIEKVPRRSRMETSYDMHEKNTTEQSPVVERTTDETVQSKNLTGQDYNSKDWVTNAEMHKMMVKTFSPYNIQANTFKKRHKSVPFKGHVNIAYVNQDLESSLMMTSAFNDI